MNSTNKEGKVNTQSGKAKLSVLILAGLFFLSSVWLPASGIFALPPTGVVAGTYGDTTHVGQFTVDATGRLTSASNVIVSGSGSAIANYSQTFAAVTSVVLTHNAGTTAIGLWCYDNASPRNLIIPQNVALTSTTTTTVTFSASQSGMCVVNSSSAVTITGSGAINFGLIADLECLTGTFTITGALTGDSVAPAWPSTLEAGLTGSMLVSAANTVQVRLCNFSGIGVDPASQTFGGTVVR